MVYSVTVSQTVVKQRVGPWVAEFAWPIDVDQGGPRSVTIRPAKDADPTQVAAGISSTVVRRLDFAEAARKRRELRAAVDAVEDDPAERRRRARAALRKALSHGVDDRYLAILAAEYVHLVVTGERAVTAALAEMVGRSPETVRAHLKEARRRELLTASKGRAGGELTDRAWRVLGFEGA
ncbi:hypothetical protein SAMN05443637_10543 [Pseudonocardia thermophila]|uniref:Uncharacterized protein n=1 Tax=Pseudonocardia thermophila TaxID=1848 RepID=A0A1M6RKW5_PSETH|nr:hypothetical protein SAMN05443637_10543 [Pseudonocardia thermophila]